MPGRRDCELNRYQKIISPTIRDIWEGIRTQKRRYSLSFFAIAIGIASLTILLAVLSGLEEKSQQMKRALGVNVVGIFQQGKSGTQESLAPLQERHAQFLAENLPDSLFSTTHRYEVSTPGSDKVLSAVATDDNLIHIRQWTLSDGRFFDQRDMENGERHAVVSQTLSQEWNWIVGDRIILQNMPFKVIGIVYSGGSALDIEPGDSRLILGERVVFIPKTVTPTWLIDRWNPQKNIDAIFWRVPDAVDLEQMVVTAQNLLSQRDYEVKNLSWVTPKSLIQEIEKLQKTIRLTAGSIALLCLILGGTTLMSLMIANVRDRVTEIGLRRALGASSGEITLLFILEGCLVTGTAALAAVGGTHLFLIFGKNALPVPLKLGPASLFIPLLAALGLAVLFSYWPAKAAARIMPSEALRNE